MRRIVLLSLVLSLSGCGYKTWWNPPFSGGYNPNQPSTDSENMRRVMGDKGPVEPLTTEPGDIWPGKPPPPPTLKDLQTAGGLSSQPEAPVPGSPLNRGTTAALPIPSPSRGSSTPPGEAIQGVAPPRPAPPLSSYAAPVAPPARDPRGQVIQTPSGPNVVTGSGPGYQTTVAPGGGQSIVVPNGNGTNTVIHADGRIETVPTPK